MSNRKKGKSAAEVAELLRQHMANSTKDFNINQLHEALNIPYGQLKQVIRGLPAEFGLYNKNKGTYVKYYAAPAGAKAASRGARRHANNSSSSSEFHCSTCRQDFDSAAALDFHKQSSRHKVNLLAEQLKASGGFHANLGGLQVSEFEETTLKLNERQVLKLTVDNLGNVTHVLSGAYQVRTLPDVRVVTDVHGGVSLPPGSRFEVEVEVQPASYGIICTLVMLDFGFVIARELRVECDPFGGNSSIPDISAKSPYQKRKFKNLLPVNPPTFVPGEKEKRPKMPWLRPPRQHDVPKKLRRLVAEGRVDELQAELDKFKQGPADLRSHHREKMHLLLHLEELQQEVDVRSYDLQGVELETNATRKYLTLKVPRLAESRPSVLRGDALYVSRADGSDGGKEWQGFVHIVRQEEVCLCFDARFHRSFIRGLKYNVRFAIKRTTFVFMHEALDVARGGMAAGLRHELLVPPVNARSVIEGPVEIPCWRNASIGRNPEQAEAVRCILAGTSCRLPFVLWGPPGTGKTSTLVEAATQLLALQPSSRLLLVAPSNLAADLLALRLLQSGRPASEMLRVCAFSRPYEDLLTGLEGVVLYHNDAFQLPSLQQLTANRLRVVVVTALMAAKLHALGVPGAHFTHIMFDEAGQAEEPLALCALAGLAGPDTSVVLAGDPKQLGPVIHSGAAKEGGLGLSLLERLTHSPPYATVVEGGAGSSGSSSSSASGLIVKLVRNYRSHPKLLELPSQLFYQGELKACASPEITHTLLHWDKLPNKNFPMIFHSIVGKDEREEQSPSWFNVHEALLVLKYIEDLRSIRRFTQVTSDQIAVVTPYRRQVQRIRKLLAAKGHGSVQVGSVEQLQGQEKRVIIISTVRSTPEFLSHDFKHKLGFVANAKRFNVAITRAQALLIVVGNPAVLMHDKHWLALLLHCQAHGACVGQPMPDLSEAEAAAAAAAGGDSNTSGAAAGSSSNGNGSAFSASASSGLQQEMEQLGRLMASIAISNGVDDVAQQLLLQDALGFSGLVDEVGGGMARRE